MSSTAAARGTILEHPVTGMRLEIVRSGAATGGELLEMIATYPPRSPRPPMHFHPRQEERFEILAGEMRAIVGGEERMLPRGTTLVLPPGTRHTMWNSGAEPAAMRWESRPALRTQEFVADLVALAASLPKSRRGRPGLLDLALFVPRY